MGASSTSLVVNSAAWISSVFSSIPMWTLRQTRRFAPLCLRVRRKTHFASQLIPRINCFCSNPECFLIRLTPPAFTRHLEACAVDQQVQRTLRPPMFTASVFWRRLSVLTSGTSQSRPTVRTTSRNRLSTKPSLPLRANKSETFDCLKFTLEGAGERSDGNARTSAHALACRA